MKLIPFRELKVGARFKLNDPENHREFTKIVPVPYTKCPWLIEGDLFYTAMTEDTLSVIPEGTEKQPYKVIAV